MFVQAILEEPSAQVIDFKSISSAFMPPMLPSGVKVRPQHLPYLVLRKRVELVDGAEHVNELDHPSTEQVEFSCGGSSNRIKYTRGC